MKFRLKTVSKHSIRMKLTITLTISILLIIVILWVLNRTFLGGYYLHSKNNILGKTYSDINAMFPKNTKIINFSDSQILENELNIERMEDNRNVSINILPTEKKPIIWFDQSKWKPVSFLQYGNSYWETLEMIRDYALQLNKPYITGYITYQRYDVKKQANYMELIGFLDNDYIIYIRSNLESMKESTAISNQFLAYVGAVVVILSSGIMLYISKRFSNPILQLSGIARRISDLDFEAKYPVTTQDEIGELGYSINVLSDKLEKTISELKSANNELLTDLENKVQIDEMRKEFLSNVTHELKTPIALIQGYAEGLKDNISDDPESKEFYCEVIIDEAQKMNTMVKKLLSLNQIESGQNQINLERFDLIALLQSVADSTKLIFEQKDVTLYFEAEEPLYVWADEYMIEEVITNYISNALNHIDGARIIEIKLIQKEKVVRVAIFNTGCNIPEEELNNIWIKFYKVDKARTREYGGNGIGLSIVKAIMDSHNQKCGVMNHEAGVEFWFELDTQMDSF
ncbi:hypothetical protein acsn021_32350 [Anaerocolumna cellulosilytica]|uniref:histidine kinase n=1 Tax=Anaerocolumna cellulosilytica TaxID=433286 RepID=A0A6S6R0U3_9FIRM|nr:HAMP domain-containing sensor histidine kinase [Anaerocolumna cellulosilytica]MBB5196565.1 signal transduction histidine kinase [Anaerocolumna cellulosilytica]BCJ95666.1 hypothetical protein acsn021_32350 [Anaerocolumna cellulosilytica]